MAIILRIKSTGNKTKGCKNFPVDGTGNRFDYLFNNDSLFVDRLHNQAASLGV